jgi:hypothetical protein
LAHPAAFVGQEDDQRRDGFVAAKLGQGQRCCAAHGFVGVVQRLDQRGHGLCIADGSQRPHCPPPRVSVLFFQQREEQRRCLAVQRQRVRDRFACFIICCGDGLAEIGEEILRTGDQ